MHNTYGLNESDYMALLQVFADDFATIISTVSKEGQNLLSQLIIKQITEDNTPDLIKQMSDTLSQSITYRKTNFTVSLQLQR